MVDTIHFYLKVTVHWRFPCNLEDTDSILNINDPAARILQQRCATAHTTVWLVSAKEHGFRIITLYTIVKWPPPPADWTLASGVIDQHPNHCVKRFTFCMPGSHCHQWMSRTRLTKLEGTVRKGNLYSTVHYRLLPY